jgi:DNA-binding NarL/FixJ family response regulator
VVEDEPFTRRLLADFLSQRGYDVTPFAGAKEAMGHLRQSRVDVLVADLDLGAPPSGVDLLARARLDFPHVALIALAAPGQLPPSVTYLVKTDFDSLDALVDAISGTLQSQRKRELASDLFTVTAAQAEVLRMLAEGLSNEAIAERRGVSKRAAEALVQRTLHTLGLNRESGKNPRVEAVRLWQQGRVEVR